MRVLVTGANGFVGTTLCRRVQDAGHAVRAVVRTLEGGPPAGESVAAGDIGGAVAWEPILQGIDAVIHLAGRAHVLNEQAADPLQEFRRVNVEGTRRLALAAEAAGVDRFVYVSSIGVNGEISAASGFSESDAPAPLKPYAVSKLEAEQALRSMQPESGMAITIVRPPLVYGPQAPGNFALLKKLVLRRVPLPFGSVDNSRTLVGVDNLADFLVRCVEHPQAAGELFLIGDAESVSTKELVRLMGEAADRPARLVPFPVGLLETAAKLAGRPDTARSLFGTLVVDSTKARTLLGWTPPHSLAAGLRRAFAA